MQTERLRPILGLDVVRFAAAAMVVFYHLTFFIGVGPTSEAFRLSHGQFSFPAMAKAAQYGWTGVEIFFVLSGFVIAYSSHAATAPAFLMGRVARLAPAAWICSTLTLIALILGSGEGVPTLVFRWVRTLLFCPLGKYTDGAFWTLPIEVAFYALIYAKIRLAPKISFETVAIAIAAVDAVFWTVCMVIGPAAEGVRESRFSALLLLHHGCEFALGMELYLLLIDRVTILRLVTALVCAATSLAETLTAAELKHDIPAWLPTDIYAAVIWGIAMAAIILAVIYNSALFTVFGRFANQIRLVGLVTYPLYLIHQNAGAYVMWVLLRLGLPKVVCLVITMALALGAALAIVKILEPPARKLLRTILAWPIFGSVFVDPKNIKPSLKPVIVSHTNSI